MIFHLIFSYLLSNEYVFGQKPRRALIIYNPTDSYFQRCFGEPNMKAVFEKNADHLLGPINALRKWSRNYTESGENYFDVTIFTRIKHTSTQAGWAAFAKGRESKEYLCNVEGSALYPSPSGGRPKCCVLQDQEIGQPQGIDIYKGNYCGCSPSRADWGPGKKCYL
jgi:hypothetical protein